MLAFGTANESFKGQCTVQGAIELWLQLGGRHIDTAYDYGTQPDVGRALKASGVRRADVFITTKLPGPIGKEKVVDLFMNQSLPQLGVAYVDLLLVHWPCVDPKDFPNKCGDRYSKERLDTWQGFVELKKTGVVRAIGVSNYLASHVDEIITAFGTPPAVNQVEWHLGYHNEMLLAAMDKCGVTLEAWGSLAGPTSGNPGISLSDPRLTPYATTHTATAAQIALRWSVHKGVVPITATCDRGHAAGDLAAFSFDLAEGEVAALDALTPTPLADTVVMI